jgi:hypothetical protein
MRDVIIKDLTLYVLVDVLAPVAARSDVIEGTGEFESEWSCHDEGRIS